jgi:phosphopantothenoylcysteine synthetase/decarboxylase
VQAERNHPGKRAKRIVVCACGAYSCYTLPGFVLHLLKHFADDVQVVLSHAAAGMVSRHAVEVASRNRVFVDMDDTSESVFVPHIELGRNADLILVYPASVNVIGKVANGITDTLIPALIIASEAPVMFVPVANPAMLAHPAVRRNVAQLESDGHIVCSPLAGPEVATRESMDLVGAFPLPTLLLQLRGTLAHVGGRGRARR